LSRVDRLQRYRAEGAQTRQIRGVGLGLAIAREIVLAHGGTIECRSAEGRGSTFRVALPRRRLSRRTEDPANRTIVTSRVKQGIVATRREELSSARHTALTTGRGEVIDGELVSLVYDCLEGEITEAWDV
jgi:K+-sensing histidine kinase KdpD